MATTDLSPVALALLRLAAEPEGLYPHEWAPPSHDEALLSLIKLGLIGDRYPDAGEGTEYAPFDGWVATDAGRAVLTQIATTRAARDGLSP